MHVYLITCLPFLSAATGLLTAELCDLTQGPGVTCLDRAAGVPGAL